MDEGLGFGMRCVKVFLIFLNFIFLIMGIFTVTVGAIILVNYDNFELFLQSYYLKPAQFVISVGALTIFICFVGFLGASKESTALVNIYALLLFLLLLLELGGTVVVLIFRCNAADEVQNQMKAEMAHYNTNANIKETWDVTQEVFHCCGTEHSREWAPYKVTGHEVHGVYSYTVPYSCCKDSACSDIYKRGCLTVLGNYITESMSMFLYVCLGNAIIKIFAIVLARMLAKAIRRIKSEREMERQGCVQATTDSDHLRNNLFTRVYSSH